MIGLALNAVVDNCTVTCLLNGSTQMSVCVAAPRGFVWVPSTYCKMKSVSIDCGLKSMQYWSFKKSTHRTRALSKVI